MRSGGMGEEVKKREADAALEPLIFSIRSQRVMLDADLARLYGVSTKRFNEAFKRNERRFPEDFAFRLTIAEFANLKSRRTTSDLQPIDSLKDQSNWSQFATSSSLHRGSTYRPWAFTEHGALMAANVIRSERAVQMSIYVIRAFIRLRERAASNLSILKRLAQIDSTLLQQDAALRDIYRKLLPLLQPPPDPPRRRIGFHTDGDVTVALHLIQRSRGTCFSNVAGSTRVSGRSLHVRAALRMLGALVRPDGESCAPTRYVLGWERRVGSRARGLRAVIGATSRNGTVRRERCGTKDAKSGRSTRGATCSPVCATSS